MATLAFAAAGAAIGSTVLPTGLSIFGAAISGATIGAQAGALAGSYVDQALFGSSGEHQVVQGPRLSDLRVLGSSEGAPIPRIYGTTRLGGQVIWADQIEEKVTRRTANGGGGGKGGSSSGASTTRVEYTYYASFAVALCEGEISGIRRAWADGEQINLSKISYSLYTGTESQSRDSLIESRLGPERTPVFRGTAYVVIERLPLAPYGNRIPQLSFEVQRSVDRLTQAIKSVVLIPGSGEFAYSPTPVSQAFGQGYFESENVHTLQAKSDWAAALDQLEQVFPNNRNVSLVVSWFGIDLRCDQCQILPGVERSQKITQPLSWSVAGVNRASAYVVSQRDGRPAYGGTPSDQTVVAAIEDLKDRGFGVTFNPFILMDVAEGNSLSDPYSALTSQPLYPWRGRITVDPAPGQPGSPDKTAAAASDVAAFVGTASVGDFSINGKTVTYSGAPEWSLRRMVLHYAHVAKAAGGVDVFLLSSELRGLTWVRDGAGGYPFVTALVQLASDVRSVLGAATKISYGADWSEFFGHQPADGSGDVYFHLDPLWSSSDIDAVGIDLYWPLSDWRDGVTHADYQSGARSIYDLNYLHANVASGEGYDWYYASVGNRKSQTRSPITDGAAGKPWVFRYKDIKSWWSNQHFDRPAGVESSQPSPWVPQSKPIWFTETGCPAIDKGANQPNVFTDPKSSESKSPYFSNGARDDLMQRRYVDAIIGAFDPANERYVPGANPISSLYGGRMVDLDRIYVYAWDSRPYPEFPNNTDVWGDGENWSVGHWLTGRLSHQPVSDTVTRILLDYGFSDFDADQLSGTVAGYQIDRLMAPRDALQPLSLAYFFDARESQGEIVFRPRGRDPAVGTFGVNEVVETKPYAPLITLTRAQETELPASAKVRYLSNKRGYQQAVSEARRLTGASGRVAQADLPIVLEPGQATVIAERWLNESWTSREHAAFTLPLSRVDIEPGDAVLLKLSGLERLVRITRSDGLLARSCEAKALDREIYAAHAAVSRDDDSDVDVIAGTADLMFLDLPLLRGDESPSAGFVAATQDPWPGAIAIYGSPETSGYVLRSVVAAPARLGTLLSDLADGVVGLFDFANTIEVEISSGELESVSQLQLLNGQNAAAIEASPGSWEIIQYATAELVGDNTYALSGLLRGQAGTEAQMSPSLAAGARIVFLTSEVTAIDVALDEIRLPYHWRYGPLSRDIGDETFAGQQHTFQGVGLRPYAPVHVSAHNSGGDKVVSWIRRTRVGGDSWDGIEVPLSEDVEAYEVDILDGTTVKRTLTTTETEVVYSEADQIADFGAPQSAYEIKVYQLSQIYGRGNPRSAVI